MTETHDAQAHEAPRASGRFASRRQHPIANCYYSNHGVHILLDVDDDAAGPPHPYDDGHAFASSGGGTTLRRPPNGRMVEIRSGAAGSLRGSCSNHPQAGDGTPVGGSQYYATMAGIGATPPPSPTPCPSPGVGQREGGKPGDDKEVAVAGFGTLLRQAERLSNVGDYRQDGRQPQRWADRQAPMTGARPRTRRFHKIWQDYRAVHAYEERQKKERRESSDQQVANFLGLVNYFEADDALEAERSGGSGDKRLDAKRAREKAIALKWKMWQF